MRFITLIILLMLGGCATTNINKEDVPYNQPSSKKFSEYKYVFIKPLTIESEFKDSWNNQEALTTIENNLFQNMLPVFKNLSEFSFYDASRSEKTLIIEPHIEKLKSVSKGVRSSLGLLFLGAGSLAGSSAVILKISYIDAKTKEIIASPAFYQHASAIGASFSQNDKDMLHRISELASFYASDNF